MTAEPKTTSPDRSADGALLRVEGLRVYFPTYSGILMRRTGWIRAVDGVSFSIAAGETLALVGESGSGKTTIGRAIVRIVDAIEGSITLGESDLLALKGGELRSQRRRFQMVFQDPYSSLDPRQKLGRIIDEPLRIHGEGNGSGHQERVGQLLELVGLDPTFAERFPHQLSGGQRQRVGIARALALEPDLIVADEPVSALDVSIQAQVINLLERLQAEMGLTYLFIAHDLAVVRHISHRVAVMYLGRIVEIATTEELFAAPRHPYTVALLSAVPIPDAEVEQSRKRIILKGDIPSPAAPPSGCRFHTRCWLRERLDDPEICETTDPALASVAAGDAAETGEHVVACHFTDKVEAAAETATATPAATEA